MSSKLSRNCPEFFSYPENVWKMSGKMIIWNFSYSKNMKNSRNFFKTNSGHEQILDKFQTNSRQIPNVGNDHVLEHFPDNKQCPEFVYYYSEHFLDIFQTFCFYRAGKRP